MSNGNDGVVLKTEMPDIGAPRRGKVRDIYDLGKYLLLVTTDRVSAFDVVSPYGIPGKGKVLTAISVFWFKMMEDFIDNHIVATDVNDFPEKLHKYRDILEGRSLLIKKAQVFISFISRFYIEVEPRYKIPAIFCFNHNPTAVGL